MAKEVAKKEETSIGALAEGLDLSVVQRESGKGMQGMVREDFAVPFLLILQKLTPECDDEKDEFIEGARPGQFYNRSSDKLYPKDKGPIIIPVAYERKFVEWIPHDDGGGFVDSYDVSDPIVDTAVKDEKGRMKLENGNELMETAYHYCLELMPDGNVSPLVLSMKSTGLKKSRRWNSQIAQTFIPGTTNQAPRYLYPWKLDTVLETKGNNSWYSYDINRVGNITVNADQFANCMAFYDQWAQGEVKVDESKDEMPF